MNKPTSLLPTMGAMASPDGAERMRDALEKARERATRPAPPPDPNLPKWWEDTDLS